MNLSRRLPRMRLGPAFAGLVALSLALPAPAAERKVGVPGSSASYGGQRNVIYVPGWGYWIFFKEINSDRAVWRYSKDGQDWTAPQDVFPYLQLAPDCAASEPSVWYVDNLKRVYVAAGDSAADVIGTAPSTNLYVRDTSGNKVFVRWGTLKKEYPYLEWDSAVGIRRQRANLRLATTPCQFLTNNANTTWDFQGGGKPATVIYSSTTKGAYVAVAGNASDSYQAFPGPGALVVPNLLPDLSGYINGGDVRIYALCHENDGTNGTSDDTVLNPAGIAMAPVAEFNTPHFMMAARVDNMETAAGDYTGTGAIVRLSSGANVGAYTAAGRFSTLNGQDTDGGTTIQNVAWPFNGNLHAYAQADADNNVEGFSFAMINEIYPSSWVHTATLNNAGALVYLRKESTSTMRGPYTIDAGGSGAFPLQNPGITMLYNVAGQQGANDLYMTWTNGDNTGLYYRVCRSTITGTAAPQCDNARAWRTGTDLDNFKPAFWASYPAPIGVIWNNNQGTYFDKIITSTFPIPAVTQVSTVPANAYLTTPRYDLKIEGSYFEALPNGNTPYFLLLKSSDSQSEIAVTSTTWISKTELRASIVLSTFVNAGFDYDLR
ncbi:MAG: hypothetical protein PHF00_09545, partial [Elusimicrobia bacterium]|nr:hypothetical protein [Elusimicrobiota bacterium]